jgi:hypothetical protein
VIRDQISAINTQRDKQVEAVDESRKQTIKAIEQARDQQIQEINAGLATTLHGIRDQEKPIYEAIRDKEDAVLTAITGGKSTQDFIRDETKRTADELVRIRGRLDAFLTHAGVAPPPEPTPTPAPGAPPPPSTSGELLIPGYYVFANAAAKTWLGGVYAENQAHPGQSWDALVAKFAGTLPIVGMSDIQTLASATGMDIGRFLADVRSARADYMPTAQQGMWRTKEGPHYLHADEMVLPKRAAEAYRTGGAPVLNISVNVEGNGDADVITRAVKQAVLETETSARIGRISEIIQRQARK